MQFFHTKPLKTLLLTFTCVALLQSVFAQNEMLSLEDAVMKQRTSLAPTSLHELTWIKGSSSFSFLDTNDNNDILIIGRAERHKQARKIGTTLSELNDALEAKYFTALKKFPKIKWKNASQFTFVTQNKALGFSIKTKKITVKGKREFEEGAENIDITNKTNYAAYTIKNNLFVFDGEDQLIVTNDADKSSINGQAVHRQEFGIYKGTFWSPKGNLLAFYKKDESMVTDYPVIDYSTRPASVKTFKYPMAGDTSHQVKIGIYDVETGQTILLEIAGPKDQYLTNICWSPDEENIYVAILNRDQNHLKMNCYDAITGHYVKTVFEENDDKYIQPLHPMVFVPSHSNKFIWQSERDGYNHLYLYSTKGKLIKQLTKGDWAVTNFDGFDGLGLKAFYTSTAESPITRNLYSVTLAKDKTKQITSEIGTHHSLLSDNGKFVLDNFQSTTTPRKVSIYNAKGKEIQGVKESSNPLGQYKLGELNIFKIKNDSADELYCRMYKPINFDATKKYPVIVYVYGGPNVQLINDKWNAGGSLWFQYMAQKGFVIFSMDNRGSENRGQAFEQATFKNLGKVEMQDQMVGVEYLKGLNFIDTTRMGIMGWSYGGFMTTSLMTRYPNAFKVGVAGGPVIDWSLYEIMYTERYMDTPQTNPEGYEASNVLNYVDSLKGKLFIVHGTDDDVVVLQHSMQFVNKAVNKGKDIDYFTYPKHKHSISGKDRVHLFEKISNYFIDNL